MTLIHDSDPWPAETLSLSFDGKANMKDIKITKSREIQDLFQLCDTVQVKADCDVLGCLTGSYESVNWSKDLPVKTVKAFEIISFRILC